MAKKRIKKAANVAPVPKDLAEARAFVRRIGEHQREAARIEAELNDKLAALREAYAAYAAPHNKAVEELTEGVRIWAEAHRDELT
ncbi:MAG: host-nuclease inhibitor Gam family protein, partial [Mariprofundaceae bacterium]